MRRRAIIFGVLVLSVGVVAAIFLPRTIVDEVTSRSAASGVIADLSTMKEQIARNAMNRTTLKGAGVDVSVMPRQTKSIDANDIYISYAVFCLKKKNKLHTNAILRSRRV